MPSFNLDDLIKTAVPTPAIVSPSAESTKPKPKPRKRAKAKAKPRSTGCGRVGRMPKVARAMRAILLAQSHCQEHPDFLRSDLVPLIMAQCDCERATAYRLAHTAVEVLGIEYKPLSRLRARRYREIEQRKAG